MHPAYAHASLHCLATLQPAPTRGSRDRRSERPRNKWRALAQASHAQSLLLFPKARCIPRVNSKSGQQVHTDISNRFAVTQEEEHQVIAFITTHLHGCQHCFSVDSCSNMWDGVSVVSEALCNPRCRDPSSINNALQNGEWLLNTKGLQCVPTHCMATVPTPSPLAMLATLPPKSSSL